MLYLFYFDQSCLGIKSFKVIIMLFYRILNAKLTICFFVFAFGFAIWSISVYGKNFSLTLNQRSNSENLNGKLVQENKTLHVELKEAGKRCSEEKLPIVIYNRVPKCGSSTMLWIIKTLHKQLKFNLINVDIPGMRHFYDDSALQAEFKLNIQGYHESTFYVRHLHFLAFERYNQNRPIYINVIRDPVERFISHYYYVRNGFARGAGKQDSEWAKARNMTQSNKNKSLEECLKNSYEKCVKSSTTTLLAFFCGQEEKCRTYSDYALQKAKENVEKYYLSVGILEDLKSTLKIFEALLPGYFKGALNVSISKVTKDHQTFNKPSNTSDEVKVLLKKALRHEIEFYDFIKKRFYEQLKSL